MRDIKYHVVVRTELIVVHPKQTRVILDGARQPTRCVVWRARWRDVMTSLLVAFNWWLHS
jgi:hypothetical protein